MAVVQAKPESPSGYRGRDKSGRSGEPVFSVRRGLAWMGVSQGALFVIQFASSVVLARLLSPREMGVFAVAVAVVGLLSIIRSVGLPALLVRSTEPTEDLLASVFTAHAVIAVLMAACVAGLSALGGQLLGDAGVQHALLGMAVVPLLGIFDFLPAALMERAGNFRTIGLMGIAKTLVANGVTLLLAYAGFSTMSMVWGQVAGAAVSVAGFNVLGWQHVRLRPGFADGRNVMRYGLQMVGISGVTIFAGRMSELVLGRLQGLDALGLFSRASGLSGTLWESVNIVVIRVVFVEFANLKRAGRPLRDAYLRAVQMMTALLWPAFGGMAVLARPVVLTLYGERWMEAAGPLSLLCLAMAVLVAITMTWEVFNVSEQTGRQARIEFIRAGMALAVFSGGCLFGLVAAAGARVVEACLSVALYRADLNRMTDTGWRDLLPIYGRSAVLTAMAVLPAVGVMTAYDWSAAVPLPVVGGAVVAGVAAWIGGLAGLGHPLFGELRRLVPAAWLGR